MLNAMMPISLRYIKARCTASNYDASPRRGPGAPSDRANDKQQQCARPPRAHGKNDQAASARANGGWKRALARDDIDHEVGRGRGRALGLRRWSLVVRVVLVATPVVAGAVVVPLGDSATAAWAAGFACRGAGPGLRGGGVGRPRLRPCRLRAAVGVVASGTAARRAVRR